MNMPLLERRLREEIRATEPSSRRYRAKIYRESLEFGKFLGGNSRNVKVLVLCEIYGVRPERDK